ncbi:MAG: hypothetical protein AB7V42_04475 [Thermoleophilia bacterium]
MTLSPQRGLRVLLETWRLRGWHDHGQAALSVVEAIQANDGSFTPALDWSVPDAFLALNGTTRHEVVAEILRALGGVRVVREGVFIPVDEIESFDQIVDVSPQELRHLGPRLEVSEAAVKRCILHILGETEISRDWGGERDDIFSARVRVDGRLLAGSFALKGPGTRGPLTPRKLGKQGDQIGRLVTQPADLFVVQYIGPVASSVREQLGHAIRSLRSQGNPAAVGSVWDGIDTARLLTAYGFLDASTGSLTSLGEHVASE